MSDWYALALLAIAGAWLIARAVDEHVARARWALAASPAATRRAAAAQDLRTLAGMRAWAVERRETQAGVGAVDELLRARGRAWLHVERLAGGMSRVRVPARGVVGWPTTAQFMAYVDQIGRWAAERGIYIPQPNE